MDGSLRVVSRKFGPDDDFVKTKMDSTMDQLMVQHDLIKRGFETLLGISCQSKRELFVVCHDRGNITTMKKSYTQARFTSIASDNLNRWNTLLDMLIRPFHSELNGFVRTNRSSLNLSWF